MLGGASQHEQKAVDMQTSASVGKSLFGLIRQLPEAAKAFVQKEVELAKTEIAEKVACLARNAVTSVSGGIIALAGAIVLLGGLGVLLGRGYEQLGWDTAIAIATGLATVGILVTLVGGAFVLKGAKKFSRESFTPEKTVETLKTSTVQAPRKQAAVEAEAERPSDEAQAEALASKTEVGETLDEIGARLKPDYIKKQLNEAIHARPYHWALGSMLLGTLGGFLLKHRMRRSSA
jgi:hypothetical protein